jgi:hypothetical protein
METVIARHLVMSGWTPQAINAVRPELARWTRQLAGLTEWRAAAMLELLILQASRHHTKASTAQAHHLRSILRLREWR